MTALAKASAIWHPYWTDTLFPLSEASRHMNPSRRPSRATPCGWAEPFSARARVSTLPILHAGQATAWCRSSGVSDHVPTAKKVDVSTSAFWWVTWFG